MFIKKTALTVAHGPQNKSARCSFVAHTQNTAKQSRCDRQNMAVGRRVNYLVVGAVLNHIVVARGAHNPHQNTEDSTERAEKKVERN